MIRNFTRCDSMKEQRNETRRMGKGLFVPKESTLEFIRQFARVYQFEPKLECGLGSLIVN